MVETFISEIQFFYVLITIIWLYLSTLAYEKDDILLLYIQFFIACPLFIMLFGEAFLSGKVLGVGVGIAVLVASVYFVFLGTGLSFDKKLKRKSHFITDKKQWRL